MSEEARRWIRHQPDRRENLLALSAGLGVGLVVGGSVFYLARLLAAREPVTRVQGDFARGRRARTPRRRSSGRIVPPEPRAPGSSDDTVVL